MYPILVDRYFIKVDSNMNKNEVVGGPVYNNDSSSEVVGEIIDYLEEDGYILVRLLIPISYKQLLKIGIPFDQIIFNNFS